MTDPGVKHNGPPCGAGRRQRVGRWDATREQSSPRCRTLRGRDPWRPVRSASKLPAPPGRCGGRKPRRVPRHAGRLKRLRLTPRGDRARIGRTCRHRPAASGTDTEAPASPRTGRPDPATAAPRTSRRGRRPYLCRVEAGHLEPEHQARRSGGLGGAFRRLLRGRRVGRVPCPRTRVPGRSRRKLPRVGNARETGARSERSDTGDTSCRLVGSLGTPA
jgi:hypothetical protein